jgi:hypothetical protein
MGYCPGSFLIQQIRASTDICIGAATQCLNLSKFLHFIWLFPWQYRINASQIACSLILMMVPDKTG